MTAPTTARPSDPSHIEGETRRVVGVHRITRSNVERQLVRLGTGVVCLLSWSGTASAHGGVGHGGVSVAFPIVLGVPVLTGLLGGVVAVHYRARSRRDAHRHRVNGAFGVLLIALGSTFAIPVLTTRPILGISGAAIGALGMGWIANRDEDHRWGPGHHVDLTLGGICTHRILEGIALGTIYTVNAAVGVVGVAVIAGHTALETATVGGLYSPHRVQAFAAIGLVQLGYLGGAVIGVSGSVSVPAPMQFIAIGLLCGGLLVMGVTELRNTSITVGKRGVPK